jgi:16S rRNA (adenine(1408)-N(1))-methyltransferase
VIVVTGKQTTELSAVELKEIAARFVELVIDLGTGDGRFAFSYAREHPRDLVIGIDPVADSMSEIAGRTRRKRDRQENLLYVVGSAERPPEELLGLCDRLFIILPWGSLMRGLILGSSDVLAGVASLGKPGCPVTVLLNTRIYADPVPLEAQGLPELSPKYVADELQPRLATHGLALLAADDLPPEELLGLPSTWAKRLSHRNPPPTLRLKLRRM